MKLNVLHLSMLGLSSTLSVACGDETCDRGQILRSNLCMCDETRGYVQSRNGTGYGCELKKVALVADAGAASESGATPGFGDTCTTGGSECGGPAPFCAVQPGKTEGYCSIEGCTADPSLCPSGWSCLAFTATGFCAKP